MNSAVEIWQHAENAFWWWWGPVLAMSCASLWYMAQLASAQTASGVLARIALIMGFSCMIMSFVYDLCGWGRNGLGRIAVLFVMAGVFLMIRQFAIACRAVRKQRVPPEHFGERVLSMLVDE